MATSKPPLAITGIGLRLSGNLREPNNFWQALLDGKDCIEEIPKDRWNIERYFDPNSDKTAKIKSKRGGFIKGLKEFDAEFFGIYPNVAKALDPRQRHLLEVAYEACEDANLTLEELYGSQTASIIGVFLGDESKKFCGDDIRGITPHTAMGSADTTVPARIAFQFNLTGPAFAVDTACSSSLVAIHLACQALWNGEAKMAITGGVNLMTSHEHFVALSKGGFLSPDGYCKTFDASANGYVRGEGAAVIIIKHLEQAIADGDNIYALIRNSVVNSDGYTEEGLTVPNEFAQIQMLKKVYGDAAINPADVDYVEAHGTGTVVGDPKECFAFGNVFSEGRNLEKPLLIGSVKSNIGHTEAVAGVAGLIKLALCIKNQKIPTNLHFKNPNPRIDFNALKLKVANQLTNWPKSSSNKAAIGGVNSFGAGGTNAHAILQEYIESEWSYLQKPTEKNPPLIENFSLFALSAKNKTALKALAQKYISYLEKTEFGIQEICYTLLNKRSNLEAKLAITFQSSSDKAAKQHIVSALHAFLEDKGNDGLIIGNSNGNPIKLGFICSGQGPQWYAMGRQLIKHSKIFRETVEEIDKIFRRISGGVSLLEEMNKDSKQSRISETRIAQPAIMAVQIGLIHLWRSLGIEPEGIVGHSIGEVAAAYCAGSLNLEQAVDVIYNRSKEQDKASGAGKMLATGLTYQKARELIDSKKVGDVVSIAAINGPEMVVLAGKSEPLEEIAKQLTDENVFNKFLVVNVPFHSHYMDIVKDAMMHDLKHIQGKKAKILLYSTVTGKKEDGTHLDNRYWYKNVRDTVFFADAIQEMVNDGFTHFIEIAPHPVLGSGAFDILKISKGSSKITEGNVISSLSRNVKAFESGILYEPQNFFSALSKIWLEFGFGLITKNKINFSALFGNQVGTAKLPSYAWQHQEYWHESKEHEKSRLEKPIHPLIKSHIKLASNNDLAIWELDLDKRVETYLEDHKIEETVVFPGTGQLEVAHKIATETYRENFSHLANITFNRALFLSDNDEATQARLEIINSNGDYKIFSRSNDADSWQMNGSGTMIHHDVKVKNSINQEFQPFETNSIEQLKQKIASPENEVNIHEFYQNLKKHGLNYGTQFRLIKQMWHKEGEILAKVELDEKNHHSANFYNIIPSLFDASLHAIFANTTDRIYLPHVCESYKHLQKADNALWSYVKIVSQDRQFLCGDFLCFNQNGSLVYECKKIKLKLLESASMLEDLHRGIYQYQWRLLELLPEKTKTQNQQNSSESLLFFSFEKDNKLLASLRKQNRQIIQVHLFCDNSKESRFKYSENGYEINSFCENDFYKLFEDLSKKSLKIDKIVNQVGRSQPFNENASCDELSAESRLIIEPNLYLLQQIAKLEQKLEIFFVISGAEIPSEESANPTQNKNLVGDLNSIDRANNFIQGLIYGMVRVFINEYPQHNFKTIDIANQDYATDFTNLCNEIISSGQEKHSEIALSNGRSYIRELVKVSKQQSIANQTQEDFSGTYLITGGTSGLGLALAAWLFEKGVRNFALVSRSGPKYENDLKIISDLQKKGAQVIWQEVKADTTKEDEVSKVVQYIDENMPPLRGVIHSAGLLEDATYPNMTVDKFMKIYNPKALGAWNLHKATLKHDLKMFLLISSVSSIIGIAGQNNYSSANSFLNYLAIYRNSRGLVANSACLGLLDGNFAGMSKGKNELVSFIERTVGTLTISYDDLLNKIEFLTSNKDALLMLSPMNWKNHSSYYPSFKFNNTFNNIFDSELENDSKKLSNFGIRNEIISLDDHSRLESMSKILLKSLGAVLGTDEKNLKTDVSINKIGLDSLMLNQFRNWIQNNLDINFSLMKLAKGHTIEELAADAVKSILSESDKEDDIFGISENNDLEIIANKWIVKLKSDSKKIKKRIFCLHPVGAGASFFSYFIHNPPEGCEMHAIQLPGRENRSEEPFYEEMTKLIPDIANSILPFLDSESLFWGHSWGGVAMFEVIKHLISNNYSQVNNISNLIISASIAPQLTIGWKKRDSIRESANKSSTIEKVISTVSYIENEDLLRKILPVMRRDMEMIMTYEYKPEEKLNIPITAFGAIEDDVVIIDEIKQWQEQTSKQFTLHQVHGDHWFLSRNKEFINQKISEIASNLK